MSEEVTPKSNAENTAETPKAEEQHGSPLWLMSGFGVLMLLLVLYGMLAR